MSHQSSDPLFHYEFSRLEKENQFFAGRFLSVSWMAHSNIETKYDKINKDASFNCRPSVCPDTRVHLKTTHFWRYCDYTPSKWKRWLDHQLRNNCQGSSVEPARVQGSCPVSGCQSFPTTPKTCPHSPEWYVWRNTVRYLLRAFSRSRTGAWSSNSSMCWGKYNIEKHVTSKMFK